jgi:hypothetical protein
MFVKLVLSGVPIDSGSDPFGLDIDMFLVLRLIDDLFFLSKVGLSLPNLSGPGEPLGPSPVPGVVGVGMASLAEGLSVSLVGDDCVTNVWGGIIGVVDRL